MKCVYLLVALIASVSAFAPAPSSRTGTSLEASFFSKVFDLDLFAPNKDVNTYGARSKKNLKTGAIVEGKSYIPAGLSKAEFEKVRALDAKKKADRYAKNVAKAGKFQDYTAWYKARGTDTKSEWSKDVTKGHTMAKTKYDWSGLADKPLWAKKA